MELFSLPPPPLPLLPALFKEFDHFSQELGTINIHSQRVRAVLHPQVLLLLPALVPNQAQGKPGHQLLFPSPGLGEPLHPLNPYLVSPNSTVGCCSTAKEDGILNSSFALLEPGLLQQIKARGLWEEHPRQRNGQELQGLVV